MILCLKANGRSQYLAKIPAAFATELSWEHLLNILVGNSITRKATYFFKSLLRGVGRNEPIRVFSSAQLDGNGCIEAVYVINLGRQSTRWKTLMNEARRQ